ncbi:MAG: ROK family protein [Acholeplasmatales bacterium]|nr:ROK family protein [Acholeplasmatales bacterium]
MRVGVDVGGTTVKVGFIDNYQIVDRLVVETKKETLFDDVCREIKAYANKKNYKIDIMGFGLPGHIVGTYIDKLPNVGIEGLELSPIVAKYFPNLEIHCTNDANAAALGELLADSDKKASAYMITLGTGVGGGLVLDGKVRDGSHSNCGEIGHMFIDYVHNYECTCGLKGCLETVASATGIVRLAKQYYDKFDTKIVLNNISAKEVLDAAKQKDPLGLYVLDIVAESLGRAISIIELSVDVDTFYIGGGVSNAGDILIDKINYYYNKYAHFAIKNINIKKAKLGNDAGMLGAAYL